MEPVKAKVDFESFVGEQRQLKQHSTRKRPGVRHILSFWVFQAGFRGRQNLNHVSIFPKIVPLCGRLGVQVQQALNLPIDCADCTRALQSLLPFRQESRACYFPCRRYDVHYFFCTNFPHFTESVFFANELSMLNGEISLDSDYGTRCFFDPWENVPVRSQTEIVGNLKRCLDDLLV